MVESEDSLKLQVLPPGVFRKLATVIPSEICGAAAKNTERGIVIILHLGSEKRILGQYRGGIRFFRSFDGAAALLRQHGILHWEVDTTGWIPRTLKVKEKKEKHVTE